MYIFVSVSEYYFLKFSQYILQILFYHKKVSKVTYYKKGWNLNSHKELMILYLYF